MNGRWIKLSLALAALLAAAGCTTLNYGAAPDKPVLAGRALLRPHHVTAEFHDHSKRIYLLWGFAPVAGFDGKDMIANRLGEGDGIVNLAAHERYNFLDQLVGLLTVGFVQMRSVDIKGSVFVYDENLR